MALMRARAKKANQGTTKATNPLSFSSLSNVRDPYLKPHKQNKAVVKTAKRVSKHESLLTKLNASKIVKPSKSRRANKKLSVNLEALADALPEDLTKLTATNGISTDQSEGPFNVVRPKVLDAIPLMKHTTIKSRAGAAKKKEKIIGMERERFAKNMALMHANQTNEIGATAGSSSDKWAAIRNFIETNMEKK